MITNYSMEHIAYDVNGNATYIFRTDTANAIDSGECQVEKKAYNVGGDVVNMRQFVANAWQAAWNLDTTITLI